jgi:hypothetical protein
LVKVMLTYLYLPDIKLLYRTGNKKALQFCARLV